ncbi:MAG: molecular chaperone DnaJ [Alphaproteobacteria bacterium]|nr:molecular chaperone DnaJ [Alphaproteobacteria bacterium]MBU1512679.1 molecular chaperone DnaJ [Alphaproteobacteria bacterium]MBU2095073.1 molecular chaperone DnaJ [Alphaproteobacteria bacterium]MBU2151808.1 molecular chaperone DnaJ [Alphaproteobacteria bacterium]MBU2306207.1 molecular chaperone DnaJ [Alphaproteobacteria bacterium]
MLYLALGGALLVGYLWLTGGKVPILKRREWRILTAAMALVAFTAAAFVGVRGSWGAAIVLVVVGLWLAASSRKTAPTAAAAPQTGRMGEAEARRILGVGPGATKAEIQAAYTRLMHAVHPDKGGTAGLAAQLNAARDRLLSK